MRFRRGIFALLILTFGITAMVASPTNLIQNGDFETPVVPVGGFMNFPTGSTGITGWTVVGPEASITSGSYVSFGFSFPAESGNQWVDLTGDLSNRVEGIEQTVSTTPGTTYTLSYFVGNQVDPGGPYGTTSTVEVLLNGSMIQTSTNSGTAGSTKQSWEQFHVSFVANSSSSLIEFLNLDPITDNTNGLDNVALTPGGTSAVPEPSTIWLLTAAAVFGCVVLRKRFQRSL